MAYFESQNASFPSVNLKPQAVGGRVPSPEEIQVALTQARAPQQSQGDQPLTIVSSRPLDEDVKIVQAHVEEGKDVPHPVVARLLSWLPAMGGMVGGALGALEGAPALGVGALPMGVAGAMAGGGLGRAAENLGNAALGNPAPKTTAEALGSVGSAGLLQGGMEAAGAAVAPAATRLAGVLMQSAVKPGIKTTLRAVGKGVEPEELPVVKTLLNEGVNVSTAGISRLNSIIKMSNDELKDVLAQASGKIEPAKVAQRLGDVEKTYAKQVNPVSDVQAVREAGDEFLKTFGDTANVRRFLSPQQAQALKVGTYRSLGEKAYAAAGGGTALKPASVEAQKGLARGLKEEIESTVANQGLTTASGRSVAELNAREGAAIQAKEAIAKRVALAGNRDPVALAWLAHNPITATAFILERSPAAKSMLARGLYKSASITTKVPENVLRILVAALASGEE